MRAEKGGSELMGVVMVPAREIQVIFLLCEIGLDLIASKMCDKKFRNSHCVHVY